MTAIISKLTGTQNLITNIIATTLLTIFALSFIALISLALTQGIKPF